MESFMIDLDIAFNGVNGRDEFKRERVAERVIKLLTSDVDISPMIIDGDWGTGKTEFCCKLVNKFKKEKVDYKILYVDAFQADHADSPLMTILAEVASVVPESKKQGFFEKALPVARFGVKTALKAGVSHILRENADDLAEGMDSYIQDAANSAIDASVMALLKDHEKAKENLQALQALLAKLAEEHPIVIFIDELDRCRPDFAVQMLEVIKHTFDVRGVQFVLVTNTVQLRAAINHAYGFNVDAQRYLDKFIKFSFKLPQKMEGQLIFGRALTVSAAHAESLIKMSEILSPMISGRSGDSAFNFVIELVDNNSLSLRDVETFIRWLEIYQTLSSGLRENIIFGYKLLHIYAVFLCALRPDIARSLTSNSGDAEGVSRTLCFNQDVDEEAGFPLDCPSNVVGTIIVPMCNKGSKMYKLQREKFKQQLVSAYDNFFEHEHLSDQSRLGTLLAVFECLDLGSNRFI